MAKGRKIKNNMGSKVNNYKGYGKSRQGKTKIKKWKV